MTDENSTPQNSGVSQNGPETDQNNKTIPQPLTTEENKNNPPTSGASDNQSDPTSPATTSSSTNGDNPDFTALLSELENSKSKLAELTQISQHALADLQNFKKRTEEEKIKFISFANATLISELLPTLDNIERAAAHLPEDPVAREWANGILIIFKNLSDTLKAQGVEIIPTENQQFNPAWHEAVMTEAGPQDQIIRELEKGYRLTDRVLRRSKVTVGNGQEPLKPAPLPTQQ